MASGGGYQSSSPEKGTSKRKTARTVTPSTCTGESAISSSPRLFTTVASPCTRPASPLEFRPFPAAQAGSSGTPLYTQSANPFDWQPSTLESSTRSKDVSSKRKNPPQRMPPPQANQPLYTWGLPSSSKTDKLPEELPQRGNPFQWRKPWDADESLKPCVTTQFDSDECTLTRTRSASFSCGSPSTSENIPAADVKCSTKKSTSSSGRKAVVRKCDACRQTFIAIEFSGQSLDELPFGSPERVCEQCSSSKLKKQKQEVESQSLSEDRDVLFKELEELKIEENEDTCEEEFGPIVEETCTEEVDSDEELLWPHRWHEWPVTMYDTFDSGLDKLQKAQGSQIVDDGGDDCYTYSEFHLGTSLPCHRHKLGDPNCWLSKEPQDIPEDVVYRYFDDYSSARLPGNMSKLKIKRGAVKLKPKSKAANTRIIYKPQLQRSRDFDMSAIREDREWMGPTHVQLEKLQRRKVLAAFKKKQAK